MRDYEILRKALMDAWRDQDCNECVLLCEDEAPCYFKQAADAIEELLAEKAKIENSGKLLAAAFERLKSKVPTWISVEERLPEPRKKVLACACDDRHDYYKEVSFLLPNGSWLGGFEPTHWMPLPEPPKGV